MKNLLMIIGGIITIYHPEAIVLVIMLALGGF